MTRIGEHIRGGGREKKMEAKLHIIFSVSSTGCERLINYDERNNTLTPTAFGGLRMSITPLGEKTEVYIYVFSIVSSHFFFQYMTEVQISQQQTEANTAIFVSNLLT